MSRVLRNTTAVAAAFATNTVLTFAQLKLLTRYLPQRDLGEYYTTFAIGALVSVLAQIGLPMVVLRFTAKYDALGQVARIGRLVRFGWTTVAVLGAALVGLGWWSMPHLLPRLYEIPPSSVNVMLATGVFIVVAMRQVTYACFDGLRRMVFPAVFENLNIATITALIVFARHDLTLPKLLLFSLGSGTGVFVAASATLLLTLRAVGRRSPPVVVAAPVLPDILPFWSGAALNGLVGICFGYADKLLISLYLPFSLVSIFVIAERLTFLMKRLLAVPLQVASPEITRRWELGRREELRRDLGFMLKLQLALAMLVAAVVFVVAEVAVLVISTPEFLPAAGLLRVLAVSVVLMALYAPITTFMRAIERIHLALLSDVVWIVLYIGSGIVLVPRFGLPGIVIAHVAASSSTAVYNLVVGQRVGRILWDLGGVARIVVIGCGVATMGWLAMTALSPAWYVAVAAGAVMLIGYNVGLVWSRALSPTDRRRLHDLAGGRQAARLIDRVLFWPLRLRPRPESG